MISVYKYLEYRAWAKEASQLWKKAAAGRTLNLLAQKIGVQPPYFTNLLKQRVHLNSDQLYALCEALGLSGEEQDYLLLVLDYERSSHIERKKQLRLKIDQIRKSKLRSESHLKAEKIEINSESQIELFLRPELYLIYFFLSIPRYSENLALVASSLGLNLNTVESSIKELISLGYLEIRDQTLQKTKKHFHLSKDSPLCEPHQNLLRFRSLYHQQNLLPEDRYNFSVTFTATKETRERIHRHFLKFLSEIEPWVEESPSEEVFQLNLDLFNWSKD